MLYAIVFITGILLGIGGAFVFYFFKEWYPIVKYIKSFEDEEEESTDKKSPEEQFVEMMNYQAKITTRELENE